MCNIIAVAAVNPEEIELGDEEEEEDAEAAAAGGEYPPSDSQQQVGPVADFLIRHWQQATAALEPAAAWQVLQEVAAQEVVSLQQWQRLAAWAGQQYQQHVGGDQQQLKKQLQNLLGAAWSTVVWVSHNQLEVCSR